MKYSLNERFTLMGCVALMKGERCLMNGVILMKDNTFIYSHLGKHTARYRGQLYICDE